MKIVTVLGARPQFIKSALVSQAFQANPTIKEVAIHTGQHFDQAMSEAFFKELAIPLPNFNLNINQMNHGEMTGRMLIEIERILIAERPNGMLVYGDTNSTLAGSLAASKLNIPVFHVEAGLRSHNRTMPEEINRIITDHLSSLLFCPTRNAVNVLKSEGMVKGVHLTGDVMYDLFLKNQRQLKNIDNPFVLATIHRPANTDTQDILRSIIKGLEKINQEVRVIFPIHPRTIKKLSKFGIDTTLSHLPPFGHKDMIAHLSSAELVITDSGGVQKEAFFAKTKCITVRTETEWAELIDAGVNCLSSPSEIYDNFKMMNAKKCNFSDQFYGNGNAAKIIADKILEFFS